jgi:hypothetical protein
MNCALPGNERDRQAAETQDLPLGSDQNQIQPVDVP